MMRAGIDYITKRGAGVVRKLGKKPAAGAAATKAKKPQQRPAKTAARDRQK